MKEYKGKKIEPREIKDIDLDNSPHYFYLGKYIGFCNLDGLPHGLGELISPPMDVKFDKEKNIIKVTKKDKHDKIPWSCNGEWENGVFVSGTYNMPPNKRYEGSFIFGDDGDWNLNGHGQELYYGNSQENYIKNNIIGHVKGIFVNGSLIEGEVLNPSLIKYSDEKGIKKIVYNKIRSKGEFIDQITKGKIYYEVLPNIDSNRPEGQGVEYEGEIDYDQPHGKGTMTFEDGSKRSAIWNQGETDWT